MNLLLRNYSVSYRDTRKARSKIDIHPFSEIEGSTVCYLYRRFAAS
jgi:hypothetical protein